MIKLTLILLLGIIIALAGIKLTKIAQDSAQDSDCYPTPAIILCIIGCIVIIVVMVAGSRSQDVSMDNIEHVYLDGVSVDKDKIDISLYKYSLSEDERTLYLTKKGG